MPQTTTLTEPKVTPGCWAWQTHPLQPAHCTCVGCTRWRAAAAGGTQ